MSICTAARRWSRHLRVSPHACESIQAIRRLSQALSNRPVSMQLLQQQPNPARFCDDLRARFFSLKISQGSDHQDRLDRLLQGWTEVFARRTGYVYPGHTKEHVCFMVTSGNQAMCLIGDRTSSCFAAGAPTQRVHHPHQSGEARVKVLDMLSKERIALYGDHFPRPGIGHVAKEKDGSRYFPEDIRWASSTT